MGKKAGLGSPAQRPATHHHQRAQKLFLLLLKLLRQIFQDFSAHLIQVIQLILGAGRRASGHQPCLQRGPAGQGQGPTYLLGILHLLQLAHEAGDLDHLDRVLVVHVRAQEAHFLVGLLDLGIQLFHLLLQVWRDRGGQEAGSSLKDPLQEIREAELSTGQWTGSG